VATDGKLKPFDQPKADTGGSETMPADIPAPHNPSEYYPDQITLYGVKLNEKDYATFPFVTGKAVRLSVISKPDNKPLRSDEITMAVIYGYSFEGFCYRLDKPRVYIFEGQAKKKANGCGFGDDYSMWNIRSKNVLLEVSLDVDSAEALILDANLPGNRTPNTYGNDMQLAHRNGKLGKYGS